MTLAAVFCCAMTTTVYAQDKVEQALEACSADD